MIARSRSQYVAPLFATAATLLALFGVSSCGESSNPGNPAFSTGPGLPSGNQPGGVGSTAQFSDTTAARICVALAACLPSDFDLAWGDNINDCLNGDGVFYLPTPGNYTAPRLLANALDGPLVDFYKCASRVGANCEALGECLSLDGNGGSCDAGSRGLAQGTCEGTILSGCSADGFRFYADCGRYGTTCGEAHLAFATFQACVWPPCSGETALRCDGTVAKACTPAGGEATVADCGLFHQDCLTKTDSDGETSVECSSAQPSSSCTPDPDFPGQYLTSGQCNGTTASGCQSDGSLVRADCATFPYNKRCLEGKCTSTGTECDVTAPTTCEGSSVVACHDGFVRRVDCADLGFAGCTDGRCVRLSNPPPRGDAGTMNAAD